MISKPLKYMVFFLLTLNASILKCELFNAGHHYFQSIEVGDVFSDSVVTSILVDTQGAIWIGAQKGLARYDGYHFRTYWPTFIDNNSSFFIRDLHLSQSGKIWIATKYNGLLLFDPFNETFVGYRHNPEDKSSLSDNKLNSLFEDKFGHLWIATDKGISYLKKGQSTFYRFENTESFQQTSIHSILVDQLDNVWIGTINGLFVTKIGSPDTGRSPEQFEPKLLSGKRVNALFEAKDGSIWIGTTKHGFGWINTKGQYNDFKALESENTFLNNLWVYNINQVFENEIWLATIGKGIIVLDASTKKFLRAIQHDPSLRNSINLDWVTSLTFDHSGLLWIGSWGGGINLLNPNNDTFRTLRSSPKVLSGLTHSSVTAIHELRNGDFWIGIASLGVEVLDSNGKIKRIHRASSETPHALKEGYVVAISETPDKSVWVGTQVAGLFKYSPQNDAFLSVLPNVFRIIQLMTDSQGRLWIASEAGIFLYTVEDNVFRKVEVHKNTSDFHSDYHYLDESSDGTIWLGSEDGLYKKSTEDEKFQAVRMLEDNQERMNNKTIDGLHIDQQDNLWIAKSNDLYLLERERRNSGKLMAYISSQNLNHVFYNIISDDKGRIWTRDSMYDPKLKQFHLLDNSDGIDIGAHWIHDHFRTSTGKLLFGGVEGILMVNPLNYKPWTYVPPIIISQLKISGKTTPLSPEHHLIIDENVKSFSLEFSALDFSAPHKNKYRYKLHGYDESWINSTSEYRVANYTNLDPGKYTFELMGSNRLGDLNPIPVIFQIDVLPSWYQTWWFRLLIIISMFSVLTITYKTRVRQLNRKKLVLARQVKSRTTEIEMLNDIGKQLNSTRNIDEIFQQLYLNIRRIVDIHAFAIGLLDDENQCIDFSLVIESDQRLPTYKELLSDKNRLSVICVSQKREIFIQQFVEISQYVDQIVPPTAGRHSESIIYIPLNTFEQSTIGCFTIQSLRPFAYTKKQLDIIRTLASYTAIAIDNAKVYQSLEVHSITDQLTGLKNRRFLMQQIESDVAKVNRDYVSAFNYPSNKKVEGSDMIFFILDLDHFKDVNDTYGHSAGDEILKQLKDLLTLVFRESDYLIRWGGEEFLIVSRFTDRTSAKVLAERLRKAVELHPFKINENTSIHKTCSIGFSHYPFYTEDPLKIMWTQVLDIADRCLYVAKRSNRNGWVGLNGGEMLDDAISVEQILTAPLDGIRRGSLKVETLLPSFEQLNWD